MPTIRQKKAFTRVVENGGVVSTAMVDAGYSKATAKTPQKLTDSDGWKELTEEFLPDKDLAKVHKEGLKATTLRPHLVDRDDKGRPVYEYKREDDYQTRHRYLDTAYKLKNRYTEGITIDRAVIVNISKEIADKNALNQPTKSDSEGPDEV